MGFCSSFLVGVFSFDLGLEPIGHFAAVKAGPVHEQAVAIGCPLGKPVQRIFDRMGQGVVGHHHSIPTGHFGQAGQVTAQFGTFHGQCVGWQPMGLAIDLCKNPLPLSHGLSQGCIAEFNQPPWQGL